jgi:hypothetical protein
MVNKLMKFKSPGVYTKEVDVSGYNISKNQIRKGKINKVVNFVNSVLGIKNREPIIDIPIVKMKEQTYEEWQEWVKRPIRCSIRQNKIITIFGDV